MFSKIAVAYNESPEAGRALAAAIQLAKILGARLQTITVMERLPAYAGIAATADPAILRMLEEDRAKFYEQLQEAARAQALRGGVELATYVVDGELVDSIVCFVGDHKIDLLVIGLHRHDRISRLWSTASTLAQGVPCSLLGVH